MRFAVLVSALALAACGARSSPGPAWPERAERETDGGESIAPRQTPAVAKADAKDEEATEAAPAAAAVAPDAAAPAAAPSEGTDPESIVVAPEDTITVEEIVIEITDDED